MAASEHRIAPRTATALLLVEGYCSVAFEMIALRVLVPVAGLSVPVTGIVVTAFLAALALGYRAGARGLRRRGRRGDRTPLHRVDRGPSVRQPSTRWPCARAFRRCGRGRPKRAAEIVYVDVDGRLGAVAEAFLGSRSGAETTWRWTGGPT